MPLRRRFCTETFTLTTIKEEKLCATIQVLKPCLQANTFCIKIISEILRWLMHLINILKNNLTPVSLLGKNELKKG